MSEPSYIDTLPPQRAEFDRVHGRAMSAWQHVEDGLAAIFIRVSTCTNPEVAKALFYSPRDFSEKLTMTRNAARLALDGFILDEWTKLRTRCRKESEIRNDLAHFHEIIHVAANLAGADAEGNAAMLLVPNWSDPNRQFANRDSGGARQPLRFADIRSAIGRFHRLAADLTTFADGAIQSSSRGAES